MSKERDVFLEIPHKYLFKEVITFQGGVIHQDHRNMRVSKYAEMMFLDLNFKRC